MKLRPLVLALAFILPAAPACADAVLALDHGSTWMTSKEGQDTQGFVQIHNTGNLPDVLTSAKCTIGASTTLVDASGNPLQNLDIPPGQTVTLSAKGPHLIIKAARYRVEKDGILPCAFTFSESGELIAYLNAIPAPKP